MRINDHSGLFDIAMGNNIFEPTEHDLETIKEMIDAEDVFENQMEHACRTERLKDEAENILASLINAWQCVTRARVKAGY